jgi:alkylation response protein AidB-like acyl-CoA dehydrogenase
VDVRDSAEQAELRRSARQLAAELGPATVVDLDDTTRAKRLAAAVRDAGWLELRDDTGDGSPLASGVEAAIVADALAGTAADVAFSGAVLAADLARRAGAPATGVESVAFPVALVAPAVVTGTATSEPVFAVDCGQEAAGAALVLQPDGDGFRLATVRGGDGAGEGSGGADLTRRVRTLAPGAAVVPVAEQPTTLTADDLAGWAALGLALTSADLVGAMRGVLELTVAYAVDRRQFGQPVGSFQAVQHLLAEAWTLMEGSRSVALHAAWAVDALPPGEARAAGRVAKAYCSRASRTACETAIQVHGGIGNTWECMAHVFLRRALLSSQWFGDDGVQLSAIDSERTAAGGVSPSAGSERK